MKTFFFFSYWRVGDNLRNAKQSKPNNKLGKGEAVRNLGIAYQSLGNFHEAIEYLERHLQTARVVGDKAGEGQAYGNLGIAYQSLGDFS